LIALFVPSKPIGLHLQRRSLSLYITANFTSQGGEEK
jgi:hypothetical protein